MELLEIILSSSIRFYRIGEPTSGGIHSVKIARAFEDQYGFLQGPRKVEEFDLSKGVTFLTGQFERRYLIEKCTIYSDGAVAETRAPTEVADRFLDDAIAWIRRTASDPPLEYKELGRGYISRLEMKADASIATALGQFSALGENIGRTVGSYGAPCPPFEPIAVHFGADPVKLGPRKHGTFVFERRAGRAFEENVYFSGAPLSTKDHLRHLDELESILGRH